MQYCTIQKYYKNHLQYLTCVTNMQHETHDSQILNNILSITINKLHFEIITY
jgi:hypothetical protein